ncbi:hypothetical protein OC834_001505 [Tilletia horrida]|nr:hypothetical protein OC835_002804 [Tilletia horrida]KAK0535463.1 hypothetical protein OC834_001505 [Tilletia horrida]
MRRPTSNSSTTPGRTRTREGHEYTTARPRVAPRWTPAFVLSLLVLALSAWQTAIALRPPPPTAPDPRNAPGIAFPFDPSLRDRVLAYGYFHAATTGLYALLVLFLLLQSTRLMRFFSALGESVPLFILCFFSILAAIATLPLGVIAVRAVVSYPGDVYSRRTGIVIRSKAYSQSTKLSILIGWPFLLVLRIALIPFLIRWFYMVTAKQHEWSFARKPDTEQERQLEDAQRYRLDELRAQQAGERA